MSYDTDDTEASGIVWDMDVGLTCHGHARGHQGDKDVQKAAAGHQGMACGVQCAGASVSK